MTRRPEGTRPATTDVAVYRAAMTEAELQRAIVKAAQSLGWLTYHTTFALASDRGFPDLVLLKPPRLILAELKGPRGQLRPGQEEWLMLFRGVPGVESYLWWPESWFSGAIEEILRGDDDGAE